MRIVIGILLAGSFVSTTWAAAAAESFVVRAIFPSTVSYAVATAPAFVIELPVPFPEQFSIGSGRTMLATDVASVQLYVYGVDRKPSAVIEGKLVDNHGKSSMIFWLRDTYTGVRNSSLGVAITTKSGQVIPVDPDVGSGWLLDPGVRVVDFSGNHEGIRHGFSVTPYASPTKPAMSFYGSSSAIPELFADPDDAIHIVWSVPEATACTLTNRFGQSIGGGGEGDHSFGPIIESQRYYLDCDKGVHQSFVVDAGGLSRPDDPILLVGGLDLNRVEVHQGATLEITVDPKHRATSPGPDYCSVIGPGVSVPSREGHVTLPVDWKGRRFVSFSCDGGGHGLVYDVLVVDSQ